MFSNIIIYTYIVVKNSQELIYFYTSLSKGWKTFLLAHLLVQFIDETVVPLPQCQDHFMKILIPNIITSMLISKFKTHNKYKKTLIIFSNMFPLIKLFFYFDTFLNF